MHSRLLDNSALERGPRVSYSLQPDICHTLFIAYIRAQVNLQLYILRNRQSKPRSTLGIAAIAHILS